MPEVSVVVPTRDRRELLGRTLRTILWQRDVDLEVIVVDDGSMETTGGGIARFDDSRIRLLRNETARGVARARNRGIDVAGGEWIAFVDDDDLWAPDKLHEQLNAARRENRPWAYAGAVKIDAAERIVGGRPPPAPEDVVHRLPHWNAIPGGCSGVIATRSLVAETGGFDPALVNLADWDLWIRLVRRAPPACAGSPLVGYRWHSGNASLDTGLILREARYLADKHGSKLDWGAIHLYLAHLCLRSGQRRRAVSHFAAATKRGEHRAVFSDVAWLFRSKLEERKAEEITAKPSLVAWRIEAESWLSEIRS